MLQLLVPAAVVTWVVPLSPQAHFEIHNLQVRALRVHRKVLLVLVGLTKSVEGG